MDRVEVLCDKTVSVRMNKMMFVFQSDNPLVALWLTAIVERGIYYANKVLCLGLGTKICRLGFKTISPE